MRRRVAGTINPKINLRARTSGLRVGLLTLPFSLLVHRTGEPGRPGASSSGLALDSPGLDHFNAYSHCIVGVTLAIMRTLAM